LVRSWRSSSLCLRTSVGIVGGGRGSGEWWWRW
jgi:hypothetical protein